MESRGSNIAGLIPRITDIGSPLRRLDYLGIDRPLRFRYHSITYRKRRRVVMGRILNRIDAEDLCTGAAVLGTGGGGPPELGLALLNRLFDLGKPIRVITAEEVPDEEIVVHPAMVPSYSAGRLMDPDEYMTLVLADDGPLMTGLKAMEEILSRKVFATLPVEMGGYNTPVAAILAGLAGLAVVDGDTIGRGKPEIMLQSYTVLNIPITPMVLTDFQGNSILVRRTASFRDAERIARAMCIIGGGTTTVRCPVKGKVLKRSIIHGGITRAIAIGRALREAEASGRHPGQAVIETAGGTEIFLGEVSRYEWEDREGFLWGTLTVGGIDRYGGHELKIWLKNENLLSWLDEAPYVVTPDLLCILDTKTGRALTNTRMRVGQKVLVFAVPSDRFWRRPDNVDLVSPRHFGFDIPYVPMEQVIRKP
jgi:DUF917 family protein